MRRHLWFCDASRYLALWAEGVKSRPRLCDAYFGIMARRVLGVLADCRNVWSTPALWADGVKSRPAMRCVAINWQRIADRAGTVGLRRGGTRATRSPRVSVNRRLGAKARPGSYRVPCLIVGSQAIQKWWPFPPIHRRGEMVLVTVDPQVEDTWWP